MPVPLFCVDDTNAVPLSFDMMSKFFLRDSPQPSEEQCPCSFILLHTLARMLLIPRRTRPERGTRHPRRDARAPRTVRRPRGHETGPGSRTMEGRGPGPTGFAPAAIIDDMFKAIGEQTVTMPGTGMAETIVPSIAQRHPRPSRTGVARSARRSRPCWRTALFSRS